MTAAPPPSGSSLPPRRVRRALAVLAVAVGLSGAVLAVVGALERFPRLVVPAVLLGLSAALGLRALGGYGLRRRWAVLAALVAGVWGAALGLRQPAPGWLLLGGSALFLVGAAALFHALRGTEDPSLAVDDWRAVPPPRRAVLFVNPRSGGGAAVAVDLVGRAEAVGVRVEVLDGSSDLAAMARDAVAGGADCLGAAGGDGTLGPVAQVAADKGLPFVCVPVGTRNHFALDLGLDRDDPVAALGAFTDGMQRRIDLGEVSGRVFLNNVSLGAYGEVVASEQYRDHKVGTALRSVSDLVGPHAEPIPLRFTDGAGARWKSAVVVLVSNNVYDLAPRPGFGSRASLADGELGVVAVSGERVGSLLMPSQWSTPTFEVRADGPLHVGVDGEAVVLDAPLRFRVRPRALRVRIPRAAPGRSPAAARFGVARRTLGRLRALFAAGAA